MRKIFHTLFLVLILSTFMVLQGWAKAESFISQSLDPSSSPRQSIFLRTPLHFEANHGQTDPQVKFLSRGSGYSLFLTDREAVLALTKVISSNTENTDSLPNFDAEANAVLRMRLVGANPTPDMRGEKELPGKAHYFIGNDPTAWQTDVPTYAQTRYSNVYPGIDLVYYGNQRQLEYDFVVAPGENPSVITMDFQGAAAIVLEPNGDLLLHTSGGMIRQQKPIIYQEIAGKRQAIQGGYLLKHLNRIGFQVAAYDTNKPLIIDPVLVYSTYLGGSSGEALNAIAVDSERNIYVQGVTGSIDFPTKNPLQPTNAWGTSGLDMFVAKLTPDGSAFLYSTYFGGSGDEREGSLALDTFGHAYVTGLTESSDFPTMNPLQPANAGREDAFVAKLTPDGSALVFSTYLGGQARDLARDVFIDSMGSAYVIGDTASIDFPTTANAFQKEIAGNIVLIETPPESGIFEEVFVPSIDIFITRLSPDGSALVYSTFLGGTKDELGTGLAVTDDGSAHVTGETTSTDFPVQNAFQGSLIGRKDAFVAKLTPDGSALVFSSYLGGHEEPSPQEIGQDVQVDSGGVVYVTGRTNSSDFPTLNPLQGTLAGEWDAFVTKLTSQGEMVYSTFFGGSDTDEGRGIAVDALGTIYLTGHTRSIDFPLMNPLQDRHAGGDFDVFALKLIPNDSGLVFSTYLGGNDSDVARSIAVDPSGIIYIGGVTQSTNFPTINPIQSANAGDTDGFVMKIEPDNLAPTVNAGSSQIITLPNGVVLDGTVMDDGLPSNPGMLTTIWSHVSGPGTVTFGNAAAVDTVATFSQAGTYVLRLAANDSVLSAFANTTVTVNPAPIQNQAPSVNAGPAQTVILPNSATLDGTVKDDGRPNPPGVVTTTWSKVSGPGVVAIGNPNAVDTTALFFSAGTYVLRLTATDGALSTSADVTITVNNQGGRRESRDVNGDGKADIVWRNSNGATAIWFMNGTAIASAGFPGGVPLAWQIAGVGDVNGDGKADVIWRNSTSGTVAIWLMNGVTITSVGFPGSAPPAWGIQAVGDVNGDGKADIVWRNTSSGAVSVWFMNGATITSAGFPPGVSLAWQIAGVGDVNGDGNADVIWRKGSSGTVAIWLMNGLTITSVGFPGTTSVAWKIEGVGDTNSDGKADLIWKNDTSGVVVIWLMNGATIASSGVVGGLASAAWALEQVGDSNGDGKADVIWRNSTTGAVDMWLMNGLTITTTGSPGVVPTDWEIQ